jgi:hypothetical protein
VIRGERDLERRNDGRNIGLVQFIEKKNIESSEDVRGCSIREAFSRKYLFIKS